MDLGKKHKIHCTDHPDVRAAQESSLSCARILRSLISSPQADPAGIESARQNCATARALLKRITRAELKETYQKRDQQLHSVLDTNPTKLFKAIKKHKSDTGGDIQKLSVKGKIYSGKSVCDGLYDSLSSLKEPNMSHIHASSSYVRYKTDYDQITKICSSRP